MRSSRLSPLLAAALSGIATAALAQVAPPEVLPPATPPALVAPAEAAAPPPALEPLVGADAFQGWEAARPGQQWRIDAIDLPEPFATESATNGPRLAPRGDNVPLVGEGYSIALFAEGLEGLRTLRVAENGDVFAVESSAGRITVFRPGEDGLPAGAGTVFATGLERPYGLQFYPSSDPQWVYVAEASRVVRFPYQVGDTEARGAPEVVLDGLPTGGHWTRDIAFSPDGSQLYVAVGSMSNAGQNELGPTPADLAGFQEQNGLGAAWGEEEGRAVVLVADADGGNVRTYATGIRNCSGLAIEPATGAPWCATNERDGLGDNLPTDYVTRVQDGGFYGWPWYYIGPHEDPRHAGERTDLRPYVVYPDVLIQAHSAPLGLAFYRGEMFPESAQGDVFVALHGSWNRGQRTGYKIVRVLMESGQPTGAYEDFVTGFVVGEGDVWGRPVGVAVAADGALLISEDGNNTIWRVTYVAPAEAAAAAPAPAQ